jgi:hypothetical protein
VYRGLNFKFLIGIRRTCLSSHKGQKIPEDSDGFESQISSFDVVLYFLSPNAKSEIEWERIKIPFHQSVSE